MATKKTAPTTNKAEYDQLLAEKTAADKAFYDRKLYNAEHDIPKGLITDTIIKLHKKGLSNKQITEKGFNKGTVRRQVRLFTKGKRTEKTTVRKYLPSTK